METKVHLAPLTIVCRLFEVRCGKITVVNTASEGVELPALNGVWLGGAWRFSGIEGLSAVHANHFHRTDWCDTLKEVRAEPGVFGVFDSEAFTGLDNVVWRLDSGGWCIVEGAGVVRTTQLPGTVGKWRIQECRDGDTVVGIRAALIW